MDRRSPERTCVVCRQVHGKHGLVRVARLQDGSVVLDPTGKGPGRGAYVCRSQECWHSKGLVPLLSRALRVEVSAEDRARLASFASETGIAASLG